MQMADDFLTNKQPIFALPPIEENESINNPQNTTQMTFNTNMSSGGKDFMQINRDKAKNYNMYKKPMICEQLDDNSKSRLEILMKDIDDNLDEINKEKIDFYNVDASDKHSQYTKIADANNAYLYSKMDMDQMEKINDSLRKMAPMLPPCDYDGNKSVMDHNRSRIDNRTPYKEESKYLYDDNQSMRSLPLTTMSKRSNFTMITLKTQNTAMTKLPKERKLREMAEQRMVQS